MMLFYLLRRLQRKLPPRTTLGLKKVAPTEVWILAPPDIPSRDIYYQHIVQHAEGARVEDADSAHPPPDGWQPAPGAWVVVIRYACTAWLQRLRFHRPDISRITWFMDDDLPSIASAKELPRKYRHKTDSRYRAMRSKMASLQVDFAFSTPELAARYPQAEAEIWAPVSVEGPTHRPLTYFYHGTSAHRAEIQWLVPVVKEVQRRIPSAWFEIMCDAPTKKLFRGIPRVKCLHPLAWSDYLAYTANYPQEVGLAPLLETSFNLARAPVKFFDITRSGAAGVYSDLGPFPSIVEHGQTGVLLPNNQALWVEAIEDLLTDERKRRSMADAAQQFCHWKKS